MEKPDYHIFVCNSFRVTGEPQGTCNRKNAVSLLQTLEEEVVDREINAVITSTGCLKMCDKGPIMVVYPQGWWYGEMDEDKIDQVLDALEEGNPVEELMLN